MGNIKYFPTSLPQRVVEKSMQCMEKSRAPDSLFITHVIAPAYGGSRCPLGSTLPSSSFSLKSRPAVHWVKDVSVWIPSPSRMVTPAMLN